MIRIALDGSFDATVCQHLVELQEKLRENGFSVSASRIMVPGVKVELVTGLAIASLTMTTISTLINVINFWKGQHPATYRVFIETTDGSEPIKDRTTRAIVDAVEKGQITGIKIDKV